MAFAVKVMNTYCFEGRESQFRFFSNNKEVFDIFSKSLFPEIKIEYHSLEEISLFEPKSIILNLFERKIDYTFLESFDFPIHLLHFSYLSLEPYRNVLRPWIQALHGKISHHKNLCIENYAVSLLPGTGWVFPEKNFIISPFSRDYFEKKYSLPGEKKWISLFCYPDTQEMLEKCWFFELFGKEVLFLTFGKQKIERKNAFLLPFLTLQEHYCLLLHCKANIVRGENSLIAALEAKKPFFWDIYKESNMAHIQKIQDFVQYLETINADTILIETHLQGNIHRDYNILKEYFRTALK